MQLNKMQMTLCLRYRLLKKIVGEKSDLWVDVPVQRKKQTEQ